MFWRFGAYANISTIDNILDKADFTLEQLLDEGDLIQELKQHNAKLIEYLRNDGILEKLLEYVTVPKLELVASPEKEQDEEAKSKMRLRFGRPRSESRTTETDSEEEEQEKKRNRYAFVAAEVLSSDNWSIYDALMENQPLLRNFWGFLKREAPLDPLQASYFTKVNESLFDKKTDEMLALLKSIDGAVQDMLRHVDCPMIMDLLLKIITLERSENGQGIVEWLYAQDLMPTLLSLLGPEHNWATQTSAGDFMKAIITVSANASQNEQTCIGPNELTRQLVSKPCVEQLIKYMLGGGNPLTVGVGIVIEVIRKNNSDYDPDVGAESNSTPSSRDPIYLGTLLRMFADHVPDFMDLIMNAPAQQQRLDSTFGTKIEPLGFDRFKTCELMAELLHCSNMGLLNEVGSEQLIAVRDAERQKLRQEGKLAPARGEDPNTSADDLTMRAPHTEERKLEVTNVSDDEGFEEVTHSKEMNEDTSHEFVQAEEEIPRVQASSTLGKDDDDFVDEPLTSPRPKHATLDSPMDDADLIVAPLSPSKKKAPPLPALNTVDESTDKVERLSLEEKQEGDPMDVDKKAESEPDDPESPLIMTPTSSIPDPPTIKVEEKPVPGPSTPAAAARAPAEVASKPTPADIKNQAGPTSAKALVEQEPGEASIIVAHRLEGQISAPEAPEAPVDPVVGDYLKMQFVKYKVVPTILSFFFRYPWNNFLHNVVYDVVQQVFNGPMDRGFNPTLAISLFESADVTAQIINGQTASEESQAKAKTRMGFMGHLTLIAEEVVKFTERHPPELLSEVVMDKVMSQSWINYVEGPLAETRERDNAILGGVRPEVAVNKGFGGGLGAVGLSGLGGGLSLNSGQGSSALAEAGLNGGMDQDNDGGSGAAGGSGGNIGSFTISTGTLMSGFGSSSDEDDDENEDNEEDINNEVSALRPPPRFRQILERSGAGVQSSETEAMGETGESTSDVGGVQVALDPVKPSGLSPRRQASMEFGELDTRATKRPKTSDGTQDGGLTGLKELIDVEEDAVVVNRVPRLGDTENPFGSAISPVEHGASNSSSSPEEPENPFAAGSDKELDEVITSPEEEKEVADIIQDQLRNMGDWVQIYDVTTATIRLPTYYFRAYTDPLNNSSGSLNPPSIPPPPPPPPPLNIPPSRARIQLAARLAMHNQKSAGGSGAGSSSGPASFADATGSNGDEPELVHRIERPPDRPRNPFADDDDDEDEGIDSDDDDDDPAAPPPRSWGGRGGWWREVLNRGGKGAGSKGPGEGDGNDSIEDEEDETGSAGAEDDEEFGEFAMPELSSAPQAGATLSGTAQKESEEGSEEGDKEPEKVILKPLPVHPPAGKTGFGSLWPFGGEKKEEGGDKGEEEKEKSPAEQGIKGTVEAKRRMSIEEPDEDEVVV
ncbi:SAPS-domain-containing protein [Zalerion maritima]|uniref:SAPS-domain-containing protein n=1 Tax=Zalerion maritima TaxID=339359 RepID=A0AAD5RW13_9PEZI|nr:SAPS-domain-containing protein [Zalerion maritima]